MGNLKSWYAQLKKLATKKKKKERELRQLNLEMGSLNRKIGGIQVKIEKLNGKPIELSPHAVMRFQERIQYMDLVDIGKLIEDMEHGVENFTKSLLDQLAILVVRLHIEIDT